MKKVTKQTANKYFNCLIFGGSRSGKTYLTRSLMDLPESQPVLFLSCDNSYETVVDLVGGNFDIRENVDLEDLYQVYTELKSKDNKYKTVVIDGLTHLHRSVLDMLRTSRVNQNTTTFQGIMLDEDDFSSTKGLQESEGDYGNARRSILKMVRHFRKLPVNVIMMCLSDTVAEDRKKNVRPNLSGQLRDDVPSAFSNVGYLYIDDGTSTGGLKAKTSSKDTEKITRKMVVQPSKKSKVAGFRTYKKQVPTEIVDPTFGKLIKLLNS